MFALTCILFDVNMPYTQRFWLPVFVTRQHVSIKSIHKEDILSSPIEFNVSLLLIGSKEMILNPYFVVFQLAR